MSEYTEWKSSLLDGKNACYACRKKGGDTAGDNFHYYGEGQGGYCHACEHTIPSDEWLKENGEEIEDSEEEFEINTYAETFSIKKWKKLQKIMSQNPRGHRGLTAKTCKHFNVYHEYDTETGEIIKQFYPQTKEYKFCGMKFKRIVDKKYFFAGETGNELDLSGQYLYKNTNSKWVVVTAGELDQLSAHQMLEGVRKEGYEITPVVSPCNGEGGSYKQLKNQYIWFDQFDKIILCYDNDDAGKKAVESAVKVLPKGKVYVMKLGLNDSNCYIWDADKQKPTGREKEWINCFFKADKYVPYGVTSSKDLEDKMREYLKLPRIPLPPFMHRMQKMLGGGLPASGITNILAASGIGKTTFVDSIILNTIINDPRLVGIVSLECSEGEYGVNLSSAYCKFKVNILESVKERLEYLDLPDNVKKRRELWQDKEGDPRFYLVDADVETMRSKIEYLIRAIGCKIIVLDPIQDIFDGMADDEQAKWMKWEKDISKSEDVAIINISHSRKSGGGQKANSTGADLNEEDMMGHSSIFKSGSVNIILGRDKEAEDEIERNTTSAKITKARGVGRTGRAGEYYYDNETHTLQDKQDYLEANPPESKALKQFEIEG